MSPLLPELLRLAWRGSLLAAGAAALDGLVLAGFLPVAPAWRKAWWLVAALGFLVPLSLPDLVPAARTGLPAVLHATGRAMAAPEIGGSVRNAGSVPILRQREGFPWLSCWLGGAAGWLAFVGWQTARVSARWSRHRLSTDPRLLDLLESCKATAGVTAPIGLVVSDTVGAPAILGWLRPRILLPSHAAAAYAPQELRAILFHELAHFRSADVPVNWLCTAARALHWFNPLAHLAAACWARAREEAADRAALAWLGAPSGEAYGATVLRALREAAGYGPLPTGALAISESVSTLKRRMKMIGSYARKSEPKWIGAGLGGMLLLVALLVPLRAQAVDQEAEKKAAVAAMMPWLKQEDEGHYQQNYDEAAASFRKAVSPQKWLDLSNGIMLGKCDSRQLVSTLYEVGKGENKMVAQVPYVVAQFRSSYQNLKYAVETVTFEKESDGVWRMAGYFVRPGS